VYDGLNRRIRTQTEAVVNHGPASSPTLATQSDYDPLVEFLEVGLGLNGERTWKIHGPDLSGGYGGMQGIGGLEATIVERSGVATGLLSDRFGHILARLEGEGAATTVNWQPAKLGGYGALPGSPLPKLAIDADVATVTAWRSRSADPTGLIYLGARYYDPETGRFLTPDPAGHAASFSLYDYAGGDPVNFLDPDGRFATESGKEALDLGLRAWGGIKELGLIGSDMMGHTAASLFGDGDHYEGSSQLYQNIAAHPENYTEQGMRDSILDGALAVERNISTLGLYDTIRGFEHAAATGDYRDAQDASLAMLLLNLGLRSDPLVGRPSPNGVPPSSNTETPSAVVQDVAANAAGRTNGQLVQEIATRAEAWGARQGIPAAGSGPVQGTLKHGYAQRLLDRYQSMYGSRGLQTEVSYLNGQAVPYGTKGSVRLDVYEPSTGSIWDYKFTPNPTLPASRVQRIINQGPSGINSVDAVGP
jgi:RHS repeat-associated protein